MLPTFAKRSDRDFPNKGAIAARELTIGGRFKGTLTAADDFPCPNRLHSKRILPERRRRDPGRLDSAERGEGGDIIIFLGTLR